jgi:hypothetical protein
MPSLSSERSVRKHETRKLFCVMPQTDIDIWLIRVSKGQFCVLNEYQRIYIQFSCLSLVQVIIFLWKGDKK